MSEIDWKAVAEIAIRAFARAKNAALAENRRRGVPSYGTEDDPKPVISPEKMQRRRAHVRTAVADSRIEGLNAATSELPQITCHKDAYAAKIEIVAGHKTTRY